MNSRLNFHLVICNLQILGHKLIFVSTKPTADRAGSDELFVDENQVVAAMVTLEAAKQQMRAPPPLPRSKPRVVLLPLMNETKCRTKCR